MLEDNVKENIEEEEPPCLGCTKMNKEGECESCIHKDNNIWH